MLLSFVSLLKTFSDSGKRFIKLDCIPFLYRLSKRNISIQFDRRVIKTTRTTGTSISTVLTPSQYIKFHCTSTHKKMETPGSESSETVKLNEASTMSENLEQVCSELGEEKDKKLKENSESNDKDNLYSEDIQGGSDSKHGDGLSNRCLKAVKRKGKIRGKKLGKKNDNRNRVKKLPGYGDEILDETEYYLENGLRKVYPYYYSFSTYAKRRWLGRTLMDIFSDEFEYKSTGDYEKAILNGEILVNSKVVSKDYKLRDGDFIENSIHRHETGVIPIPIKIIEANEDIIVIDKPPSIPVHPCGRYRHNSVVFILAKEYGYKNLRTIYRLDRLTSGVLIFGVSKKRSLELEKQVLERKVEKKYVCRVEGKFPDGVIDCDEPLDVLSPKLGLYQVKKNGKESSTSFERISFNGKSSVVKCNPKTGRTHQIRVHLQWLGYPILNDPLYNSEVWGEAKGKHGNYGKPHDQLIKDITSLHSRRPWAEMNLKIKDQTHIDELPQDQDACRPKRPKLDDSAIKKVDISPNLMEFDPAKIVFDENCSDCKVKYMDPKPCDLILYLHAFNYKGPDWEYTADPPKWADENWEEI